MAAFVVDNIPACAATRRQLGATAWFVLEELVIRSALEDDGSLRAQVSTRDLAVSLGLNKDTMTRALAQLRARGVVAVLARGGAAGASIFAIDLPAGVTGRQPESSGRERIAADRSRRTRVERSRRDQRGTQLSLLS